MTINIGGGELKELKPRILVMGIGGAGGNAINAMIEDGMQGVEFVAVNTDAQDLKANKADAKIQIGMNLTKGLGAGAKHDIGQAAADESLNEIVTYLQGDVRDQNLLENIFQEYIKKDQPIQGVIHFAGLKSVKESITNPTSYWDTNVNGTLTLIKVMTKYKNFLLLIINNKNINSKENSINILRYYGIGAQIIKDLNIKNMILISRSKKKIIGLEGFGLKIIKQIIIK